MKTMKVAIVVVAALLVSGLLASQPATAGVSFGFFYSNLSSHGNWLVSGSYGHVWQPAVYRPGWNPYYDGHWMYTDVGWAWDSDYAWGAVPYHYGTWVNDPYYGWVWVPGYTWAPSWVVWRTSPGYVGWAPVSPGFSIGVSFHFGDYHNNDYVFLGSNNFLCNRVGAYAVPVYQNNTIINNTTIVNNNITVVNNVVHNNGPDVRAIERASGRPIKAVQVSSTRSVRALQSAGLGSDAIRVPVASQGRGLKAAEPVSARTPLPATNVKSVQANASQGTTVQSLGAKGRDSHTVATSAGTLPSHPRPELAVRSRSSRETSAATPAGKDRMSSATRAPSAASENRSTLPVHPRPEAASQPTRSRGPEGMVQGLDRGSDRARPAMSGAGRSSPRQTTAPVGSSRQRPTLSGAGRTSRDQVVAPADSSRQRPTMSGAGRASREQTGAPSGPPRQAGPRVGAQAQTQAPAQTHAAGKAPRTRHQPAASFENQQKPKS